MKTTAEVSEDEAGVPRCNRARAERETAATALADSQRRRRMAELVPDAGACPDMLTVEELRAPRWRRETSLAESLGESVGAPMDPAGTSSRVHPVRTHGDVDTRRRVETGSAPGPDREPLKSGTPPPGKA